MRHFKAPAGAVILFLVSSAVSTPVFGQANANSSYASSGLTADGDKVGTGLFGTLPFKLTLHVNGGYDDNVTTSNQLKQGSAFTDMGAMAEYDFGDSRTQINLTLGANYTYYFDYVAVPGVTSNDYDINIPLRLLINYKASPRFTFASDIFLTYTSEPDITISQGANNRAGNYFYTQDKFTGSYLWSPRFATATSYTLGALHYDDDQVGFFNNRWENTFGNEFRFMMAPTTTLVAEYRFQLVTYQDVDRDSTTHYALGGLDHTFDPRFTMSLRAGAQFRDFNPGGSETGPYVEANFNYAAGKQTVVTWTNRYGLEEPDNAFSQSRETFRTGLTAVHNFTPKVSANLGAYYEHDDYKALNQAGVIAPAFTEQVIDLSFSVRYSFTRYWGVQVGYNYTDVVGDLAFREYSRNRVWGGVNVTF